jgi:HAD superfamily hydrolase (TIGR01509 family)
MIKAVIFDFDGTITKPFLDFRKIKEDIGFPEDEIYLLEKMFTLPPEEKERAFSILAKHEREAVKHSELNEGVYEVLDVLKQKLIKTALLTRNSRLSMNDACKKHNLRFDFIVTREDAKVKPEPDGIILARRKLNIPLGEILMVGDYQFDIIAGQRAGVKTVLLTNGTKHKWDIKSDYTITNLIDLITIIADTKAK